MAKLNGKRIRRKNIRKMTNNISTEVVNCPPVPHINSAENLAMAPVANAIGTAAQKKEKLSGYIFMCNGTTKPECYVNRVFGLPAGRKDVVEKIKPGTKLFLFDTDVKLLYGVYEAVSSGGMNLQPTAFGGRFPAQVNFKICMDCLPLPLSSFRTAIKDNFQGSKFAPELNDQQVGDILWLFRPIVAPSSATLQPLVPTAAHRPWVQSPAPGGVPGLRMPPAAINSQLNLSLNTQRYQPYMARPLQSCLPQTNVPQFVQNGLTPYTHHHYPSATHQAPGAHVNQHQFAENQPSYFSNEHPKILQESYSRYMTTSEVCPPYPSTRYNSLALPTAVNHIDRTHGQHTYPTSTPLYGFTLPPYSGPTDVDTRSYVPVSSYYSYVGSAQINR